MILGMSFSFALLIFMRFPLQFYTNHFSNTAIVSSELVFIGNICGFSSKFFCRQGKNLQAYFRMARIFRTCLHKKYMWIFEHNFVADKAKIRRRAVARQVFFTQYAAKFAEKTRVSACEDWFLHFGENSGNYSDSITTNFYSCFIAATEYNSNQSSGIFHR